MQSSSSQDTVDQAELRELARQLAGFFIYLANVSNRELLSEIADLDLSLTQLKALALLDTAPEVQSVKQVAEGLGLSLAATSRSLDGLVKRGLVEREEDALDRRVRRVCLSAAGKRRVQTVVAIRVATLERLLETFSDHQRESLATALAAVLERDDISRFQPRRRGSR